MIAHTLGFILFVAVVLVVTQDIQIYPGALFSIFKTKSRSTKRLPYGVESFFIDTPDHKRLELWHLPVADPEVRRPYVGIVFHGNAGSLENFLLMQLWFEELGIPSYSFDYRGFGNSSGWPRERGIHIDSDAFWNCVIEREQVDPSRIIVCGFSLGCAFAARMASLHQPKLLVLIAPFVSVDAMMRESLLLRWLRPFVWNHLRTIDFVAKLERTELVLMHGSGDSIVPPHHSQQLANAYTGSGGVELLSPPYGHNEVFYGAWEELKKAVARRL